MRIEGFTPEEILALPEHEVEALMLTGKPVVCHMGTAQVLGQFHVDGDVLHIELSHIDGGGEGILPALWLLAERYARRQGLADMDWIVHAVHCARPNLKLRRVLERRGFQIVILPNGADVYHKRHVLGSER